LVLIHFSPITSESIKEDALLTEKLVFKRLSDNSKFKRFGYPYLQDYFMVGHHSDLAGYSSITPYFDIINQKLTDMKTQSQHLVSGRKTSIGVINTFF
jgi:hypothetical protein